MKKNQKIILLLFLAICVIIACSTLIQKNQSVPKVDPVNQTNKTYNFQKFLPTANNKIYHHTYYSLSYNEKHEQADWVYYLLTKDFVNGTAKRKDNFREDDIITTKSASLKDYKNSGYDRGHLCAAADMKLNEIAMSETFFMSNMSPQLPGFNRGEWKKLEAKVRDWVIQEDSIIVVTGPIFKNNIENIGENKVTVPGYYYKVIYDVTKPQKMIAFILPHLSKPEPFTDYQTSVNEVEKQTGIDFFSILDDEFEEQLEANQNW
ncbi:DNA/RNA non-specific endonuclease [Wenyingzhuangia marina]|uniref:Endonuclease n=1 Tax=Wenyingzhuangia marina TaxID=1195760 RepID=A0A1M5RYL6_9FLAO|nr:DNA/RNA non-specific endonuclease [Wenyingzhuangia marina]GGF78245.1 endonuclease [Wenyingzhuangia marina]SHH31336.1 endonuclease G [Wenyingzhuangia marina]